MLYLRNSRFCCIFVPILETPINIKVDKKNKTKI